ncbi:hypothetical protein IV203_009979 [Nitzschia inconspicua]|uniref:Uncharacterized protein n=1 Tax=Nitzschia inconspicua TaxID=303405 RepID=A0A9K3KWE6_9STRA|nr:hypothetical protein IV203_009979 [Nitzschia inconspicua]
MESLSMLHDFRPSSSTKIPLIVTVDGPYGNDRGPGSVKQRILQKYIDGLKQQFANHTTYNVTILQQRSKVKLIKNIRSALPFVTTKFIHCAAGPLWFAQDTESKQGCPTQRNLRTSLTLFLWNRSDNNHFTTKAYYEEMFSTVDGFEEANFMEVPMRVKAREDCSKWGTWLYGKQGHGPMIQHLDGKHYLPKMQPNNME